MVKDCTILGIDPGTNILGFGVIRVSGGKPHYEDMGVVDLRKEKTHYSKLRIIHETIDQVCESYHPDVMAIESPFYGRNAQVIFKLGRAQGAAIIAAAGRNMEIFEYAPRAAKEAITGNGAASKEQVSMMLRQTLGVDLDERFLDATDALALAMCHFYKVTSPLSGVSGGGSWEKFVRENPGRIK